MTSTIVPTAVVIIARVKIDKDRRTGWYILRSTELGKMAIARTREILRTIAANRGWTVVKAWA